MTDKDYNYYEIAIFCRFSDCLLNVYSNSYISIEIKQVFNILIGSLLTLFSIEMYWRNKLNIWNLSVNNVYAQCILGT